MAKSPRKKTKTTKCAQQEPAPSVVIGPLHYRLSPSSGSRWLICHYSAQTNLDDKPNVYTKAGNIAHEYSCAYLRGEIETLLELEDGIYEHTVQLVPDRAVSIARSASHYASYVQSRPGHNRIYETKVEHRSIPDFGGTIDAAILDGNCLSVVDLKTGKWRVSPENNPQLMSYLCLARQLFPEATEFTGTIVQPLVWKRPKTASFSAGQLDIFEQQVKIASTSNKKQSGEHCLFCPLLENCREGKLYALENQWSSRYRHIEQKLMTNYRPVNFDAILTC